MTAFTDIDLSRVAAPQIVEALDFETILAAWKADFLARYPDAAGELDLESEPVVKLMETGAYRELVLRQRVNDGARAVMLAYATGTDLENLAAIIPMEKKMLDAGDDEAIPPVEPTYEDDDDFRSRVQLAPEAFSTAGPDGAYIWWALTVTDCKDASVDSPNPCEVVVTVLGRDGDGTPTQALLDEVAAVLTDGAVRPLTDQVTVQAPQILEYPVAATLEFYDGPDQAVVLAAAREAAQAYADEMHGLGTVVSLSGIYAALHQPGVRTVHLTNPAADIESGVSQVPYCTSISVEAAS